MKTDLHVVRVGDKQTTALTESVPFNRLRPTHCHSCGSTGSFKRQAFHIHGVPESKRAEDHLHESVRQILFQKHGVSHVFFKTHQNDFYADSAICCNCGSPNVVFDIEFTDDIVAAMAALTGDDSAKTKADLEDTANAIRSHSQTGAPISHSSRRARANLAAKRKRKARR